jgi:hypothetical protein
MNLLDHGGALLPYLQKGLVGGGIFSMIQGLLMSSFLSFFLGGLMGTGGMITKLIQTGLHHFQPILDQTQQYLDLARANGMPVDDLKAKMINEMPRHMLPKRLIRYALFTMLGRGGASFWLGAAGMGAVALTSPTTLMSVLGVSSSVTMMAQAVILSGPEILDYRQMVRPDFVMDRIDDVLHHYGAEVKSRELAKTFNLNENDMIKAAHTLESVSLQSITMGIHKHSFHGLYEALRQKTPALLAVSTQMMESQSYQKSSIVGIAKRLAAEANLTLHEETPHNLGNLDLHAITSEFESAFGGILNRPLVRA